MAYHERFKKKLTYCKTSWKISYKELLSESDAGFPQNAAEERVLLALCTARDYPHQFASQCLNEFSNGVRQSNE
jgi:hypothetical protein